MIKPDYPMYYFNSDPILTTPNNLQIYNENGENLVTIDLTSGEITYGENYKADEAAKIFWNSLSSFHKINTQADTILQEAEEMVDEILEALNKTERGRLSAPPGIMDDAPDGYFN